MLNRQQNENRKIQDGQRFIASLRFSAVRLYAVRSDILYATRTDAKAIRFRAESIFIDSKDQLYGDLNKSIQSIVLVKSDISVELGVCASLLWNDKEIAVLYFNTYWSIVQIGNDFFTLRKNAPILLTLRRIIKEKFGPKYL